MFSKNTDKREFFSPFLKINASFVVPKYDFTWSGAVEADTQGAAIVQPISALIAIFIGFQTKKNLKIGQKFTMIEVKL